MTAPRNPNYAATVVSLSAFVDLPNCDFVKAAIIFNNSVIVSKDGRAGDLGLFFPAETQLSQEFLAQNNLFRKAEYGNVDPSSKGGFFEQHGRVKTMKFRGHKSEGFWIPISCLDYVTVPLVLIEGSTFDFIGEHEICRKYIPRGNRSAGATQQRGKTARLEDAIVEGQFRFHYDTENLRRNAHKVLQTDFISITDKWHGTSAVFSKVLVKRKLGWFERLLKRVGVAIKEHEYGLTYSSRRVIKAVNGVEKDSNHFYSEDIWGVVAKEIEDLIPAGFTIYGEIVGFTPSGEPIQKDYTYGCLPGQHKLVVYRVTSTNVEGRTVELSWPQVQEFCRSKGLDVVPTLYCGKAADVRASHLREGVKHDTGDWSECLLAYLEGAYVNDQPCAYNGKVPAEGIVLRIDRLSESEAFKLKNFAFLERESKELDNGVIDTETAESAELEAIAA